MSQASTTRPLLSEGLRVAPAGLLRFEATTGAYYLVRGMKTHGAQAPSNAPILFSTDPQPVASTAASPATLVARTHRFAETACLTGLCLLLALAYFFR